jgi:subtilisin family serine protease
METQPVLVSLEPGALPAARAARPALPAAARALVPRRLPAAEQAGRHALPLANPLTAARVEKLLQFFRVPDGGAAEARPTRRNAESGPAVRYFPNLGMLAGTVDARGRRGLEADPGVRAVDPLPVITPILPVGPARLSATPAARVTWGIRQMRIERLWARGLSGAGILIGHLDTGVDGSHPAFFPDAIAAFTIFDAFGREVTGPRAPIDTAMHGTHTAGTLVGRGVDGRQVGVAPGASLAAAVVIEGGQVIDRTLAGIDWSLGQGVRILNLSLGVRGQSPAFQRIMETVRLRGVLPVVAVGNEGPGTSRSPGNAPPALSVGAIDRAGTVADFSSSQAFPRRVDPIVPDLVAPGVQIQSAAAGGGWITDAGTSMAVPHVSGLAALLWEALPTATAAEIEAAIRGSCDATGVDPRRGGGGVPDGPRALEMLTGVPAQSRRRTASPRINRSRRRGRR